MLLKPFGNAHHECDFQTELRADSWALETSQYAHSIQKKSAACYSQLWAISCQS